MKIIKYRDFSCGPRSLIAQTVKRLPTVWETQVQSLSQEDPLEKEMAPHSSTLAWKIPWMEEPGRLQSMGHKKSDTTERLHFLVVQWLTLRASSARDVGSVPGQGTRCHRAGPKSKKQTKKPQ